MAYPPAYVRAFSFTDYEVNFPGEPKPGDKLDIEYDAVANALTATQNSLALIQRADGALANDSVGEDQLQDGLLDGIVDGVTADAEAAAAAAAASAAAAATSASSAATSATDAATQAGIAAGHAATAGVSQSIAQGAAVDAADSATEADVSADVSVQAANDTAGSVAACEAHVERAFEWAELLTGPVLPAPPGWPEAVDDGMFSSKWWAIRARDFNSTDTIDLGPGGEPDIGVAFDNWDAIPGNDLGLGQTFATWGTPPHTYILTDRDNPSDPASWTDITGGPGPPGPANTLTVGTVTTGAPGSPAIVTITGTAPNQVLNMTIPAGATGATGPIGPAGPPNALAIGTVTTVPDGSPAAATITGISPSQTLNLTIPAGPQGIQGIQGIQGVPGDPTTLLASDAHVTGDWYFDPTTWFGHTAAQVTAVKAAAGMYVADVFEAAHVYGRLRLERDGGSYPVIRAARVNGTFAAQTPVLVDEPLFGISGGGTRAVDAIQGLPAEIIFTALENWTATANGSAINFYVVPLGTAAQSLVMRVRGDSIIASVPHLGPNGSVALPAYSFASDPDTGIYNYSVNVLGLTTGGALRAILYASALEMQNGCRIYAVDGDVAGPGFAFSNDNDTGLFLNGTNSMGFSAGGTLRLNVSTAHIIARLPVLAIDGSAAAPAYSFENDLDTGMYRNAANNDARLVYGGVESFYWSATYSGTLLPFLFPDGSLAAPAITFRLDTDTGIYRFGNNTAGLVAGTAGVMLWNPSSMIMLKPIYATDGVAATPAYAFDNDTDTGFYRAGPGDVRFASNGAFALGFNGSSVFTNLPVYVGDGSAGAPGMSFNADTDTGIFRAGPNQMRFAAGTVTVIGITTDGAFIGIDGTNGGLGSPYLYFQGDTDTGFYRAAANTIGVSAGAVLAASFSSTGVSAPAFTSTSSRAIKRETGAPSRPANILARLRPLLYRLLEGDDREQLGLIAEEVQEVCPQLSDGKSVAYDRLAILLLAAWQDEHLEAA